MRFPQMNRTTRSGWKSLTRDRRSLLEPHPAVPSIAASVSRRVGPWSTSSWQSLISHGARGSQPPRAEGEGWVSTRQVRLFVHPSDTAFFWIWREVRWSSRVQPRSRHLYRLSAMFSFYRGARSYTYSDNHVAGKWYRTKTVPSCMVANVL